MKLHAVGDTVSQQAQGVIAPMELQTNGVHILGTGKKNLPAVQGEEIGTLPHFPVLIVTGIQGADEVPLQAVCTLVEEDSAAAIRRAVADDDIVGAVRLPPHFGVPEICRAASLGQVVLIQDRIGGIFLIVQPVADGHALGLDVPQDPLFIPLPLDSCVHQQMLPVG